MDTVTLIRSAIRGLLAVCDGVLEGELRGLLTRDDDYRTAGKPVCDYEDRQAREQLIDALANDAHELLGALDGRDLPDGVKQAAALLAAVVGQDLDEGEDGVFRIARRVAKDRIVSTGTSPRTPGTATRPAPAGLMAIKGHVAVDPDSELITATTVTAGNVGDGRAVEALLASELAEPDASDPPEDESPVGPAEPLAVYGDSVYGAGIVLDTLEQADVEIMCKVQAPNAPGGRYAKDAFGIDLRAGSVTLPRGTDRRVATDQERAHRPLRQRVPGMPDRGPVHERARWTVDPRRPLRAAASACSRAADRPGVEGRLHSDAAEGRAQDQSSDATPPRRPPAPGSAGTPKSMPTSRCWLPR